MGCSLRDSNCSGDVKPGRKVYLDAFEIDRTEVTIAAYAACVRAGQCSTPSDEWSYDWTSVSRSTAWYQSMISVTRSLGMPTMSTNCPHRSQIPLAPFSMTTSSFAA